jgi:hypothetical protein
VVTWQAAAAAPEAFFSAFWQQTLNVPINVPIHVRLP